MLPTLAEVEQRLLAAAPGARFILERLLAEVPQPENEVLLDSPPDLDLRRRLSNGETMFPPLAPPFFLALHVKRGARRGRANPSAGRRARASQERIFVQDQPEFAAGEPDSRVSSLVAAVALPNEAQACSVSSGSTAVIVRECGAIRSARPPVATTGASGAPSSSRMRSTMAST